MSKYEQSFGTNWKTLDVDEAVERAYALGVSTAIGEYHSEELDAIRGEMDSAYDRSVVDLAFEEGKTEGRELDVDESGGDSRVWNELVDGEPVTIDPDELPTGGRTGLPEAVDQIDAIERPDLDSTEKVSKPDFLQRDS